MAEFDLGQLASYIARELVGRATSGGLNLRVSFVSGWSLVTEWASDNPRRAGRTFSLPVFWQWGQPLPKRRDWQSGAGFDPILGVERSIYLHEAKSLVGEFLVVGVHETLSRAEYDAGYPPRATITAWVECGTNQCDWCRYEFGPGEGYPCPMCGGN